MMRFERIGKVIPVVLLVIIMMGTWFSWSISAEVKGAKMPPAAKALPRLVDVGADRCIPCVMMAPILEELKKEYAGIFDVEFVDVWKNPSEADKYRIRGIPTQIFYDATGKEFYRHMGYFSKEQILNTFKKYEIVFNKGPEKRK
jgi:thioredoxin 1